MTLCKWAEVEKLQRWGDRMKKLDAVASYLASRPSPGPGAHGKPGSIITKYSQPSLRQSVSTSGYMYTDLNVLVWSVSLFIYIYIFAGELAALQPWKCAFPSELLTCNVLQTVRAVEKWQKNGQLAILGQWCTSIECKRGFVCSFPLWPLYPTCSVTPLFSIS